jgi:hypothetical protein
MGERKKFKKEYEPENLNVKEHLGEVGADCRTILKRIL